MSLQECSKSGYQTPHWQYSSFFSTVLFSYVVSAFVAHLSPRIPHLLLQILHLRARLKSVPIFRRTVAISSPCNVGLAFFLHHCLSFIPLLHSLLPLLCFPYLRRLFIPRLVGRSFFSTNACSTCYSPSRLCDFQWPARIFRRAARCRGLVPSPDVTGGAPPWRSPWRAVLRGRANGCAAARAAAPVAGMGQGPRGV